MSYLNEKVMFSSILLLSEEGYRMQGKCFFFRGSLGEKILRKTEKFICKTSRKNYLKGLTKNYALIRNFEREALTTLTAPEQQVPQIKRLKNGQGRKLIVPPNAKPIKKTKPW